MRVSNARPIRSRILLAALLTVGCDSSAVPEHFDAAAWVNPFNGTRAVAPDFGTGGGGGNTFPGAARPFGMLQWSPDTWPSTENFVGGYTYDDRQIRGFSLTHLNGGGCAQYRDILFTPTSAVLTRSPARPTSAAPQAEFLSGFDHAFEHASPGRYQVRLNPESAESIAVRLAAAARSGLAEFRFSAGAPATVLIDAGASPMANDDASVRIDPLRREVSGTTTSGRYCYQRNRYTVYFVAQFDRGFSAYGTWQRLRGLMPGSTQASDTAPLPLTYTPIPGGPASIPGDPSGTAQAGAYLQFDSASDPDVRVRVGLSYVSVEQARANLEAETPHWDLRRLETEARSDWNRVLGRVRVQGGSDAQRRNFYSKLYHALLQPKRHDDVNGQYRGFDAQLHTASGGGHYADFSGWDMYRQQIALLAMLEPEVSSAFMQSLVDAAAQSGCLPKFTAANDHTNVMSGDPAPIALATSLAFGAGGFDQQSALDAMLKGAQGCETGGRTRYVQRAGVASYLQLGYIPSEAEPLPLDGIAAVLDPHLVWGSAATTLEYVLADFAIGQFAAHLGETALADDFRRRSANWRKLFNPASGFLEPRSALGGFSPLFDPAGRRGYTESSAAQFRWFVQHDVGGLVDALGGDTAAEALLDHFFTELNAGPESEYAFLGNEPNLHAPWLYHWIGRPDLSQSIIDTALATLYDDGPGGYPGNADTGAMGAWVVWASLGLFPAVPGTDVLLLHAPAFERIEVDLPGGPLRIETEGAGPYVESVWLDGREHARSWLRFDELRGARTLRFRRSSTPGADWGRAPALHPPSFAPEQP